MHTRELVWARTAILQALGLGAGVMSAGCGGLVVFEEPGAGGGGTTGHTAATGTTGQTGSVTTATITTGVTSGVTTGGGCSTPTSAVSIPPPLDGPCGGFFGAQYICFPHEPADIACTGIYSQTCVLEAYSCGFQEVGDASCPDFAAAQCCFTVVGDCPVGRPFVVGGVARLASCAASAAWAASSDDAVIPNVDELDAPTREALAAFWTREGLTEHASVASFSRFVLELLALGAPADLVKAATQATADEVEHARLAFSFASAYAGRAVGPSALDVSGALDGVLDRTAAAVSIASEGCVAETVSALQIRFAADEATDPAVRAALRRIADEEMRHAELAWRALAWLLETGDLAMRAAVARVFDDAASYVGLGPVVEAPGDADRMRAHGYLPLTERRLHATEVLATVVAPCARALVHLGSPNSQASYPGGDRPAPWREGRPRG